MGYCENENSGCYITEFCNYYTIDGRVFREKEDAEKYVKQLELLDIILISSNNIKEEICLMVDKEMSKETLHNMLEVLFGPEKVLDDTMWKIGGPITLAGDTDSYIHYLKIARFILSDKGSEESFGNVCKFNNFDFIGKYEIKGAYFNTIDEIIRHTLTSILRC